MPIEFRCTQCDKLLRTADGTAGKQAKCPACGTVVTIPVPPSRGPESAPSPPSPAVESPFGAVPPPPPPGESPVENPYQAPADYAAAISLGPVDPAAEIIATPLDLGGALSRSWTIFAEWWVMSILVVFVVWVISFVAGQTAGLLGTGVLAVTNDEILAGLAQFGGIIIANLFGLWLSIGEAIFFLKLVRGQDASLGDVFTGGPYFLRVLGAGILVALIILPIILVCVGPGIVVMFTQPQPELGIAIAMLGGAVALVPIIVIALMFSQIHFLIIDRNVDILSSLGLSKAITTGNKLTLFLIGLLQVVLLAAGFMMCCVGVFVPMGFVALMRPVIYLAMTGQPTAVHTYSYSPAAGVGSPVADG